MRGNLEAARIIARRAADCTVNEQQVLGKRYTDFMETVFSLPNPIKDPVRIRKPIVNLILNPLDKQKINKVMNTVGNDLKKIASQDQQEIVCKDLVLAVVLQKVDLEEGIKISYDTSWIKCQQDSLKKAQESSNLTTAGTTEENQQMRRKSKQKEITIISKKVIQLEERLQAMERALTLSRNIKFQKIHNFHPQQMLETANEISFFCTLLLKDEMFPVILKMIPNFTDMAPNFHRGSNENELMILHKLNSSHPNIINILSEFVSEPSEEMMHLALSKNRHLASGRRIFVVTEWHPRTLEEQMQLGRQINVENLLRFSLEIVDCFLFLLNNHIVHRNVSLKSVYVSEDDRFVLGEFGESVECDNMHRCQMKHLRGGNAPFTAPEVLKQIEEAQNNGEAWIDFEGQYSWEVGCLIFCTCFGRFPFPDYPETKNVGPLVFPGGGKGIPNPCKLLVAGLLEPNKEKRIKIQVALEDMTKIVKNALDYELTAFY